MINYISREDLVELVPLYLKWDFSDTMVWSGCQLIEPKVLNIGLQELKFQDFTCIDRVIRLFVSTHTSMFSLDVISYLYVGSIGRQRVLHTVVNS